MKILLSYLGRWRSANRSRYHQLAKQLCLLGHQVYVLEAPPTAINDLSFSEPVGFRTSQVPADLTLSEAHASTALRAFLRVRMPKLKLLKKGLLLLASMHRVFRLVDEAEIDVLLTYSLPQVRLLKHVECHKHFDLADNLVAMMEHEAGLLAQAGGMAAARHALARILREADTVTVASSLLADQVKRPAFFLPNGADLDALDQADGLKWRSRGLGPCVGFVGAFEYWVDLDLLVAIARKLPKVTFLLVGYGRCWSKLKRALRREGLTNVYLTGPMPYEQAMDSVAAMDVCLIPFRRIEVSHGSCPLKLFEYAGLRKPIISTRISEVIRIGRGWVRFADDVEEFAAAIEYFLSNPQASEEAGAAGRAIVEQRYCWPQIAQQFLEFLALRRPSSFEDAARSQRHGFAIDVQRQHKGR